MHYNIKGKGYNINEILRIKSKSYNALRTEQMPEENMDNNERPNNNNIPEQEMPQNNENQNDNMESNEPRFPISDFQGGYINGREMELMRTLYGTINTFLYPFVTQVLDEFEFIGSSIYSPMGIDRETISQMVDRVINLAEESLDQVGEVKNDRTGNYLREWDRWGLLRSNIESLLLNDIFSIRRPAYFAKYAPTLLR